MNDNYRNRLESYLASMLQAKRMLSMGIITPEDYADIDTIMNEKYGISSCSLYCGIDLIYDGFRKTTDEIAVEVIAGLWGNGAERKEKLTEAGYDYSEVQKRVNEMLR